MKVGVTGAGGYVGSVLCRVLLTFGYKVKALDNLMRGNADSLIELNWNPNFEFINGDITNIKDCEKFNNDLDYIAHCAALVGEPICARNEKYAHIVNVEGTYNLLNTRKNDIPFIFTSTGSVYGKVEGICTELSPCKPLSVYGQTKLEAENLVKCYINTLIYRYATGCGLSPNLRLDLLVNDLCYRAMRDKTITIFEGDSRRTFINVADMVFSIIHGIKNFSDITNIGKVFNVGDESMNMTKIELANKIKKKTGCAVFLGDEGYKDPDQRDYAVSTEKFKSTGWWIRFNMNRTLDDLLKGLKLVKVNSQYYQKI